MSFSNHKIHYLQQSRPSLWAGAFGRVKAILRLPPILRFGVLVFLISGALDLFYHAYTSFFPNSLDAYFGPDGYYAHLALFFGMLFIVIGIIAIKPKPAPSQAETPEPAQSRQQQNRSSGGRN